MELISRNFPGPLVVYVASQCRYLFNFIQPAKGTSPSAKRTIAPRVILWMMLFWKANPASRAWLPLAQPETALPISAAVVSFVFANDVAQANAEVPFLPLAHMPK